MSKSHGQIALKFTEHIYAPDRTNPSHFSDIMNFPLVSLSGQTLHSVSPTSGKTTVSVVHMLNTVLWDLGDVHRVLDFGLVIL